MPSQCLKIGFTPSHGIVDSENDDEYWWIDSLAYLRGTLFSDENMLTSMRKRKMGAMVYKIDCNTDNFSKHIKYNVSVLLMMMMMMMMRMTMTMTMTSEDDDDHAASCWSNKMIWANDICICIVYIYIYIHIYFISIWIHWHTHTHIYMNVFIYIYILPSFVINIGLSNHQGLGKKQRLDPRPRLGRSSAIVQYGHICQHVPWCRGPSLRTARSLGNMDMGVSINGGTSTWRVSTGKSAWKWMIWGYPFSGNVHTFEWKWMGSYRN